MWFLDIYFIVPCNTLSLSNITYKLNKIVTKAYMFEYHSNSLNSSDTRFIIYYHIKYNIIIDHTEQLVIFSII